MLEIRATKPQSKDKKDNLKSKSYGIPLKNIRQETTNAMRQKASSLSLKISEPSSEGVPKSSLFSDQDSIYRNELKNSSEVNHNISSIVDALADINENKIVYAATATTLLWMSFIFSLVFLSSYGVSPEGVMLSVTAAFSPPALGLGFFMLVQRQKDASYYASVMRDELKEFLFSDTKTTEEIASNVEMMCRQASEVSTQSKEILKSLQRARQGLRNEIRDFSGVSQKAEFHIERLSASLSEKAKELVKVTEDIGTHTSSIETQVSHGIEAWQNASDDLLSKAEQIGSSLEMGADKIVQASRKTDDQIDHINETMQGSFDDLEAGIDNVAAKLKGLSSGFDDHTASLSEAVDHVSSEVERLGSIIAAQASNLEDVTEKTVQSMTNSTDIIQSRRQELDESAQSLEQQSNRIVALLDDGIEKMSKASLDILSKSDEASEQLSAQTRTIKDLIAGVRFEADAIEEAGQIAANKLLEAQSSALSGAEQIGASVRKASEVLTQAIQGSKEDFMDFTDKLTERAHDFTKAGKETRGEIEAVLGLMDQSRTQMQSLTDSAHEQVEKLSTVIDEQNSKFEHNASALVDRVTKMKDLLMDPVREIETAVREADEKHKKLENTLLERSEDLRGATSLASEAAATIKEMLQSQTQEISVLSGQISGQARVLNEQLNEQQTSLSGRVEDTLSMIEKTSSSLESATNRLGGLSASSKETMESMSAFIEETLQKFENCSEKTLHKVENLEEDFLFKIRDIEGFSDKVLEDLSKVAHKMAQTIDTHEPIKERIIKDIALTEEHFERLRDSYEASSDSNLARLKQVGISFEEHLEAMKGSGYSAIETLSHKSDDLCRSINKISDSALKAQEHVTSTMNSFRNQSSDIHLMTDQALLKIEGVQKIIKEQFQDFSTSVGQSVTYLQNAGQEVDKQSEKIGRFVDTSLQQFGVLKTAIVEHTNTINEEAERKIRATADVIHECETKARQLVEGSRENLLDYKKIGDTISIRTRELEEQVSVSLKTSEAYGRELKLQARMISDASIDSADKMSQIISMLTVRMNEIGESAHDATLKLERSREDLSNESDRLLSVSSAALTTTKDATQMFTKQSEALFKASQDAATLAKEAQRSSIRAQRESFMDSAKFVMESLNSMSVDLSRMLEGDVAEKDWKAYQGGNILVFTEKLNATLRENMPKEKASEKFAKDNEFRMYILKFIRQFEDMAQLAFTNDHGAILSSTLASSQVGMLYRFLCEIAGKENVFKGLSLKAA